MKPATLQTAILAVLFTCIASIGTAANDPSGIETIEVVFGNENADLQVQDEQKNNQKKILQPKVISIPKPQEVKVSKPFSKKEKSSKLSGSTTADIENQKLPMKNGRPNLEHSKTRDILIHNAFKYQEDVMLPLEADHIEQHKTRIADTEKAIRSKNVHISTGSQQLILEPNAPIPRVLLTPGYVTALVFYDSTGEPWPITSCSEGNSNSFSVQVPAELEPGNMVTVQAIKNMSRSNIVLTLADFSLPVVVELSTTDLVEDGIIPTNAMISFRATRRGPSAKDPIIGKIAESSVSETIMAFLDGTPPREAELISSISQYRGMDLWRFNGMLYLRTYYPVIWPAWDQVVNGTEDLKLYRLPEVPNIMISDNGTNVSLDVN